MSTETARPKAFTVPEITARKGGEPIVCLTAYTTPMARHLDPHVDILLVGDFDLMIAATCLRHGLQICTNNRRHFEAVEGLSIVSI